MTIGGKKLLSEYKMWIGTNYHPDSDSYTKVLFIKCGKGMVLEATGYHKRRLNGIIYDDWNTLAFNNTRRQK